MDGRELPLRGRREDRRWYVHLRRMSREPTPADWSMLLMRRRGKQNHALTIIFMETY